MKNQTIRERYAALTVLSQRVLPSKTAINKVATLLVTRFQRPFEATEQGRKQVIAQNPVPEGWDRDQLPAAVAEARQRDMDELMQLATPVRKVPDALRLTAADLPQPLKREGGEGNAEGVASIIVSLGSLYVPSEEERALNGATEGEEPDDAPDGSAGAAE